MEPALTILHLIDQLVILVIRGEFPAGHIHVPEKGVAGHPAKVIYSPAKLFRFLQIGYFLQFVPNGGNRFLLFLRPFSFRYIDQDVLK